MASSSRSAGQVETLYGISKPEGLPEWRRRVHHQSAVRPSKKPVGSGEEALEWQPHLQVRFGKYAAHSDEEADTTDALSDTDIQITMVSISQAGLQALDAAQDYADGGSATLARAEDASGSGLQSESELARAIATADTQSFLLSLRQQTAEMDVLPELPPASDGTLHRLALGLEASIDRADNILNETGQHARKSQVEAVTQRLPSETAAFANRIARIPDELPVGTFSPQVTPQALFDLSGREVPVFDMAVTDEGQDSGSDLLEQRVELLQQHMDLEESTVESLIVMQSKAQQISQELQIPDFLASRPLTPPEVAAQESSHDALVAQQKEAGQIAEVLEMPQTEGDSASTAELAVLHGMEAGFNEVIANLERHPSKDIEMTRQDAHAVVSTMHAPFVGCAFSAGVACGFNDEVHVAHGAADSHCTSDEIHSSSPEESLELQAQTGCPDAGCTISEQSKVVQSSLILPSSDASTSVCTGATGIGSAHQSGVDAMAETHRSINATPVIHQPNYGNAKKVRSSFTGAAVVQQPSGDISKASTCKASPDAQTGGLTDDFLPQREQCEHSSTLSTSALDLTGAVVVTAVAAIAIAACAVTFTLAAILSLTIAVIWMLIDWVRFGWKSRSALCQSRLELDEQNETLSSAASAQQLIPCEALHPFFCWDTLCYFMWCFVCLLSLWLSKWTSFGRHDASE